MSNLTQLRQTARKLVGPGVGILAVDESTATCNKRFEKLGIPQTEEKRREYRELLLTAPGLRQYISGAILYDETLRQSTPEGVAFVDVMRDNEMIPGIKVDTGTAPMPASPLEKVTHGLSDLKARAASYYTLGARFAKWRAVITIAGELPSQSCIRVNARKLARYAAVCQEEGLVPIVEPEVLMEGPHNAGRCYDVTVRTLATLFDEIVSNGVVLDEMILKCNMVLAGDACDPQAGVGEVADLTLAALLSTVPDQVAGVAFLSGGQSDRLATEHLRAINARAGDAPWPLTFSFGRALQQPAIEAWRGDPERVALAQAALLERARANSDATKALRSPLERLLA
jgi:fructose-bisphosphate aldolase, class I